MHSSKSIIGRRAFSPEHRIRVILLGDADVGKSTFIRHYIHYQQQDSIDSRMNLRSIADSLLPTSGIEFDTTHISIQSMEYKLEIWDTPGLHRYQAISLSYVKGKDVVILMYDVANRNSFESTIKRILQLETHLQANMKFVLLGNKKGVEKKRQVSYGEGKILAEKYNLLFLEINAKRFDDLRVAMAAIVDRLGFQCGCMRRRLSGIEASQAIRDNQQRHYHGSFLYHVFLSILRTVGIYSTAAANSAPPPPPPTAPILSREVET